MIEKIPQAKNTIKTIHFDCIDSTNSWAKRNPELWSHTGITVISAFEQTAGRGRFNRKWLSPPRMNIYATFCFWLSIDHQNIGQIPLLLALTTSNILKEKGYAPRIKWPNDILLSNKKVAGILCESIVYENKRGLACGIGLNVNMPQEILDTIDRPATSLMVKKGSKENPNEILALIQEKFNQALPVFLEKGFKPFLPAYSALSYLKKDQLVCFHNNQELIQAKFDTLMPDGSMRLLLPNGEIKTYYSGEFIE